MAFTGQRTTVGRGRLLRQLRQRASNPHRDCSHEQDRGGRAMIHGVHDTNNTFGDPTFFLNFGENLRHSKVHEAF
jgi:hypothetical protein